MRRFKISDIRRVKHTQILEIKKKGWKKWFPPVRTHWTSQVISVEVH